MIRHTPTNLKNAVVSEVPGIGRWRVYCDGTALGGRGATGLGAVLYAPDGATYTVSRRGAPGCNTQAEGWALVAALRRARALGACAVDVFSDSAVVIEQVIGSARTRVTRLAPIFAEARDLLHSFDEAAMIWVPRHKNAAADALARAAVGLGIVAREEG